MVVGVACVLILPAFTLLSYSSIKFINYVDSIVSVKLGVIGHFVLITFGKHMALGIQLYVVNEDIFFYKSYSPIIFLDCLKYYDSFLCSIM